MKVPLIAALLILHWMPLQGQQQNSKVKSLKITILSTMLADEGIGEWGFSALVEVDGRKILFDTGARPETVLSNIKDLKIDLSDVTEIFISHNHQDHTGGLLRLREELGKKNPGALIVAHAGEGIFYPRVGAKGNTSYILESKPKFEAMGGKFEIHHEPKEIYPGVWISGPVPRIHDERNWNGTGKLVMPNGDVVEDKLPEDQSLIFDTEQGVVILSGCGHAGIVNTVEYAQKFLHKTTTETLIGGFHLFNLSDDKINWTAGKLKAYGVEKIIGAHCTGINAVFALREKIGLDRKTAVVGAVGSYFDLANGISPGQIAK